MPRACWIVLHWLLLWLCHSQHLWFPSTFRGLHSRCRLRYPCDEKYVREIVLDCETVHYQLVLNILNALVELINWSIKCKRWHFKQTTILLCMHRLFNLYKTLVQNAVEALFFASLFFTHYPMHILNIEHLGSRTRTAGGFVFLQHRTAQSTITAKLKTAVSCANIS